MPMVIIMVKRKRLKKVAGATEVISGALVSYSDVMRWDSDYNVAGKRYKLSRLVGLGKKSINPRTVGLANQMEKDLKSKGGLLVGFPIAILVGKLQKEGRL